MDENPRLSFLLGGISGLGDSSILFSLRRIDRRDLQSVSGAEVGSSLGGDVTSTGETEQKEAREDTGGMSVDVEQKEERAEEDEKEERAEESKDGCCAEEEKEERAVGQQ